MRSIVYVVAAVAAVGIMVGIATMPNSTEQSGSIEPATVVSAEVMEDAGTLTMAVPNMHCQFACFPKVKETLEGLEGVEEVVLDEQESETVLDNRQVVVSYQPGFDVTNAISKLAERGYADSGVVQ